MNGLAGSIELYLGEDVLTGLGGQLYPVQWKSYSPALGTYHGEITGKATIQEAFRRKYNLAIANPHLVPDQDWSGIRLVLDTIRAAAQAAFADNPPILRVMTEF